MDLLDNSYIKTAARYTVLGGYDAMISEGLSKLTQPGYVNPSGAHFDNLSWPHIEQSVEAHRVRRSARYVS